MMRSFLMAVILASAAATAQAPFNTALAQLRLIPENAKRGNLSPVQGNGMTVEIDGKRVELAAGAQIRDGRNFIILPATLPQTSMAVRYQLAQDGKLQRAWLLTPQEAAQPDPKQ